MSTTATANILVGGELSINRVGYGAMRLAGSNAFKTCGSRENAKAVLRRAIELGVNFIDTADFYGPHVINELIAEALAPYPSDLVISTKVGVLRGSNQNWLPHARPDQIRFDVEQNLSRLKLDRLDLVHLRLGDGRVLPFSGVPLQESLGALSDMRSSGKIRCIALSCASVDQVQEARKVTPIVAIQNLYNVGNRSSQDMVDFCTRHELAFLPYFPLGMGALARENGPLAEVALRHSATPAQIAIAWLLAVSPITVPIPGTSVIGHLEENVAAAHLMLDDVEIESLRSLIPDCPPNAHVVSTTRTSVPDGGRL